MPSLSIHALYSSQSENLGDYIQTFAVEQMLGGVYGYTDREKLAHESRECVLIANGWWKHNADDFPPPPHITPCYVGLHIAKPQLIIERNLPHFQQNQPVGCREQHTADLLRLKGVESYVSGCLTLGIQRWLEPDCRGPVIVVDPPAGCSLPVGALNLTHAGSNNSHPVFMREKCLELLVAYQRASLVITGRLHAALPCIALGTPVVFIGDSQDVRFQALESLIPICPPDAKSLPPGTVLPQAKRTELAQRAKQSLMKALSSGIERHLAKPRASALSLNPFGSRSSDFENEGRTIPRIVHQFVSQPTNHPAEVVECMRGLRQFCGRHGYSYRLWTPPEVESFFEAHSQTHWLALLAAARNFGEYGDIARYGFLHLQGGWWVDWDVRVMHPETFDRLLTENSEHGFVGLIDHTNDVVANEFLGAAKGNKLLSDFLGEIPPAKKDSAATPRYSGPYALTRFLKKTPIASSRIRLLTVREVLQAAYSEKRGERAHPSATLPQPLFHHWVHAWMGKGGQRSASHLGSQEADGMASPTGDAPAKAQKFVTGLWIGEELPPLAELCIRSYQDHGFNFRLFTYGPVKGVPSGTEILDANELVPKSEMFIHSTGSLAPFADRVRYQYLAKHGGLWTDMDVVCLRSFDVPTGPWFGLEEPGLVGLAILHMPAGHEAMIAMEAQMVDPALPMPWDTAGEIKEKRRIKTAMPELVSRRQEAPWSLGGAHGLTRALKHFNLMGNAVPIQVLHPLHWTDWESAYDKTFSEAAERFPKASAIHLWGELLRRNPEVYAKMHPGSLIARLMRKHRCGMGKSRPKILVGVCSCRKHAARRQAVRETWLKGPCERVETVFFVGGGGSLEDEPDTVPLNVNDGYERLPEKVRAFFVHALGASDFDWLFKCDDDTYVVLARLPQLLGGSDFEIIGSEYLSQRGSPSGGAGYFLSRRIVELLVADKTLPNEGAEDVIYGKAAIRHGAKPLATKRLRMDAGQFPRRDNDLVTAHWCSPEKMKVIHSLFSDTPERAVAVQHPFWKDQIHLYASGLFLRTKSNCAGHWSESPQGRLLLKWFDWPPETFVRVSSDDTAASYQLEQTVEPKPALEHNGHPLDEPLNREELVLGEQGKP